MAKANSDPWADIKNFKPKDFSCKCQRCESLGRLPAIDMDLVLALDAIADELKQPVVILKGVRCNSARHSVTNGVGHAVDVKAPDSAFRWRLVQAAQSYGVNKIGVGLQGYVHLEISPNGAEPGLWVEQTGWQK
jgi:hypothetical protein